MLIFRKSHKQFMAINKRKRRKIELERAQNWERKSPVEAGLGRSIAEKHPIASVVAIVGQVLELVGDGEVEQLRVVLQHADQVLPGRRPRPQRRVKAARLTVAGDGNHRQTPPPPSGPERDDGGPREETATAALGLQSRRKARGSVVREAIVHQIT